MNEYIYILENVSMPGLVKIGRTDRSVSERVNELSSHTGVPTGFYVVKEFAVPDSIAAEKTIHQRLSSYRVSDNREFFRLPPEDAVQIVGDILGTSNTQSHRDFDREDQLVVEATDIAIKSGYVLPGMLVGLLKISYEEAEFVIQMLKGRSVINGQNELGDFLQPLRKKWLNKVKQRKELLDTQADARAETHQEQIQQVRELLNDLRDPETGEPPEILFEREDEELVVIIRGSEWLKSEAQKRLSVFM